jgi:hypothetical protein
VRQQRVDEAGAPTKHGQDRQRELAGSFDNGRRVQIEVSRPRNRVRQRRSIRQQRVAERLWLHRSADCCGTGDEPGQRIASARRELVERSIERCNQQKFLEICSTEQIKKMVVPD